MGFRRMLKRNALKKAKALEREAHRGEKYDDKLGCWVPSPLPIRKYENRKIERHIKRYKEV